MIEKIKQLLAEVPSLAAQNDEQLEALRLKYLSKKGLINQLMADFRSYIDTQYKADEHYRNVSAWRKSALINIANMGFFSSDRSIADYCRDIWYIKPLSEKELPSRN